VPVAEKTYSFRAAGDLGDRMREASAVLEAMFGDLQTEEAQVAVERVTNEMMLALLRDRERFRDSLDNQSAFIRQTVELLVQTAEKVASDVRYAAEYAEVAAERDEAFRSGAKAAAARRWRD
jgi:hypothetical protein